jgi:hypothetical protein
MGVEVAICRQNDRTFLNHSSPLSLLGVSHVVGDVGAPIGASGNSQSRVRIISLHGCGTYRGISFRGPTEEEEEEELEKYFIKVKGKVHLRTGLEGPWGSRGIALLFL